MNDEIIVFELPDGSVRYATCPYNYKKPGETNQQWLLRAFNKTIAGNSNLAGAKRILNPVMPDGKALVPGPEDHPVEHAFRGAWRHAGGGQIAVDLPKARKIKMGRIRAGRNSRFPALDAEWMKAMGQGDNTVAAAIEAKRQILRDLPSTTDLNTLTTPEALAAFEPAWPTVPGA